MGHRLTFVLPRSIFPLHLVRIPIFLPSASPEVSEHLIRFCRVPLLIVEQVVALGLSLSLWHIWSLLGMYSPPHPSSARIPAVGRIVTVGNTASWTHSQKLCCMRPLDALSWLSGSIWCSTQVCRIHADFIMCRLTRLSPRAPHTAILVLDTPLSSFAHTFPCWQHIALCFGNT